MSESDVKSYRQIKDDLDGLRLLVEKSELWVFKAKCAEEKKKEDGKDAKEDDEDKEQQDNAAGGDTNEDKDVVKAKDSVDENGGSRGASGEGAKEVRKKDPPTLTSSDKKGSAIDLDIGPALEQQQARNYKTIQQVGKYTRSLFCAEAQRVLLL